MPAPATSAIQPIPTAWSSGPATMNGRSPKRSTRLPATGRDPANPARREQRPGDHERPLPKALDEAPGHGGYEEQRRGPRQDAEPRPEWPGGEDRLEELREEEDGGEEPADGAEDRRV